VAESTEENGIDEVRLRTFMVRDDALGDFNFAPGRNVAACGLEEEERLLRDGVAQLLGMGCIVAADGYNLWSTVS